MEFVLIQAELDRFTYRPGWKLRLHCERSGIVLTITYKTPDARHTNSHKVEIVSRHIVPDEFLHGPSEYLSGAFASWLQSALFDTELHESREWLRRDGKIYDDPHKK